MSARERPNYRIAANGHLHFASAPCNDDSCVPVVVISPEDREAVERLGDLYLAKDRDRYNIPIDATVSDHFRDDMQAALREFANPTPPRPDEPMGLGAVVKDAHGSHWTRLGRPTHSWYRAHGHWAKYSDIAAVRVLSEGVQP